MLEGKSAAVINLGCKANKYESDAMTDRLRAAGLRMVLPEETADIYIVNTCSVTNVAERKSRQMLRRAKKNNPDAVVIACGCYVNASKNVVQGLDFVDVVVGNNKKKNIVEVIEQYFTNQDLTDNYIDISHTHEYEEMGVIDGDSLDHQRAYIKISDGCNQFCSYCIIPYVRGRVRSRSADNILREIRSLADEGVKEFVLTGIHISSYGIDFRKKDATSDEQKDQCLDDKCLDNCDEDISKIDNLGDLILAIDAIPNVQRIRLGSLEPRIITEEFLNTIRRSAKLCPHFHLSLQSACNETLKRMNRRYTIEEFEEKCNLLRAFYDRPALTTDVIVGFPQESEEEFQTTLTNLKRIGLYEIHVFKYSKREGTVAAAMPSQVAEEVKNERSKALLSLTAEQKRQYESAHAGARMQVLIEEEISKDEVVGLMRGCLVRNDKSRGLDDGMSVSEGSGLDDGMSVSEGSDIASDAVDFRYYTGHTANYIKVAVASRERITGELVEVQIEI